MSEEKGTMVISIASVLCRGTPYQMQSKLVESVMKGLMKMSLVELRQIMLLLELKKKL